MVQFSTMQCSAVQCSAVQHSDAQCSAVQYRVWPSHYALCGWTHRGAKFTLNCCGLKKGRGEENGQDVSTLGSRAGK